MNQTVPIEQTKFSNGEIGPDNWGDKTHPKYTASLRTCKNWLPTVTGALVKRAGFKFIAPTKSSAYTSRLIPFVFSDGQTFVLEFADTVIRFYQKGQYVGTDYALHTYAPAPFAYYELASPFTKDMLPYLKFSQVGNTITICYGGQVSGVAAVAPRDLKLTTPYTLGPWTLTATPVFAGDAGLVALTINTAAYNNLLTYNRGDRVLTIAGGTTLEWYCIQDGVTGAPQAPPAPPGVINAAGTGVQGNLYWTPANDTAHNAQNWEWCVALTFQHASGVTYVSGPSAAYKFKLALSQDRQIRIDWAAVPSITVAGVAMGAGNAIALKWSVFRRPENGVFGWVVDVPATTGGGNLGQAAGCVDDGRTPDYTKQPPHQTDPWLVKGADSYPALIGYLDQRRVWAGSLLFPSTIQISKVGDLYNYDNLNVPGADTDAFNILLASEELEQVRSILHLKKGLVLTSQGEWVLPSPISRSNNTPLRQSAWGSSWLNPIKIGTGILFNTAKSNMVRDLFPLYGTYTDFWDGQDVSILARHFLDLNTIKDWAFQSTPYSVVWMVRDDGVLLSLTYQHAPPSFGQQLTEGVAAWAQHATSGGTFEAVCAVPEPPEDAVYVVVKRTVTGATVRYIERMCRLICAPSPYLSGVSDVRYGQYADSLVIYDGHNDVLGFGAVTAKGDSSAHPGSTDPANYQPGSQIEVTLSAGGPFVAGDAANPYGSSFVFDPENLLGLGPVNGHIVGYTSNLHVTVELDTACSQAQVNLITAGGVAYWAVGKGVITTHLNGFAPDSGDANLSRGLICLADGDSQVPVVAGPNVQLAIPAVVIQCGMAYNGDLEFLDATHPQAEIRNKFKNLLVMGFTIAGTRDMWVGKDLNTLTQWIQRSVSDDYNVLGLKSGYFEERVTGEFDKSGRSAIRHFQPLPAVLSSVLREFSLGDS